MNIQRITATLALSVALGANAQAQLDVVGTSGKAAVAETNCASANPADHGPEIKVDQDSARHHLKEPRPPRIQALRPRPRIVAIDPLLPFGE